MTVTLLLSLLLAALPAEQGCVIRVDLNATGAGHGANWHDAVPDLQEALAIAAAGDELWIAEGTYLPTTGSDRRATFRIDRPLAIYGGFAGTETRRDQRDPQLYATVISGEVGALVDHDNVKHVVTVDLPPGASAEFDGLEIERGYDERYLEGGGGVRLLGGELQLTRVGVRGCYAKRGGGIYVGREASLQLLNCALTDNLGEYGGAIMCRGRMSAEWTEFEDNEAGNGGAVESGLLQDSSIVEFFDCSFRRNHAYQIGGALSINLEAEVQAERCTFDANTSRIYGGAIGLWTKSRRASRVRDCHFQRNEAECIGGALYLTGPLAMDRCRVEDNRADAGGGMYIEQLAGSVLITNSLIARNLAGGGAGLLLSLVDSRVRILNTTIVDNQAILGGAILTFNVLPPIALVNCIVWGNRASSGGDVMTQQFGEPSRDLEFAHCALESWSVDGEGGNTNAAPRFRDPSRGDYRLHPSSPLIDAGHPGTGALLVGRLRDLELQPRIQGPRADIGADEVR